MNSQPKRSRVGRSVRYLRVGVALLGGALLALSFLVGASARATGHDGYGGTLNVGLALGAPDNLDPSLYQSAESSTVLHSMCESLYQLDSNRHEEPWLATALPTISADKLTYTIPLRHGVEFNDGTPFNARPWSRHSSAT